MISQEAGTEYLIDLNGTRAEGFADPSRFLDTGVALPNGAGRAGVNESSDLALAQLVLVSLLTWRRAAPGDDLPNAGERNGWWGDAFTGDELGSRLWLFTRSTVKRHTAAEAEQYAREALAWLVTDGIAARVDVEAAVDSPGGRGRLTVLVRIFRDDGSGVRLRFADLWGAIDG